MKIDQKINKRIILKNGNINMSKIKSHVHDLLDFDEIVNANWSTTLLFFIGILLGSWLFFAVLWWLICYAHGDFEWGNLPDANGTTHKPCIYQIRNFWSCLFFSIETQHTVGYGIKAPSEECPEAIFLNVVQCIIGFIMQGTMAVVIFTKMTLPKLRAKTLFFTKYATVYLEKGVMQLAFRVGDVRKNQVIETRIRAFLVQQLVHTMEGEALTMTQTELILQSDACTNSMLFNWPMIIEHQINEESPFYHWSPASFRQDNYEIMVVLEGNEPSTGQMIQIRTSYSNSDVIWGKNFEKILHFDKQNGEYAVNFSRFNNLIPATTPLCSAADYKIMIKNK